MSKQVASDNAHTEEPVTSTADENSEEDAESVQILEEKLVSQFSEGFLKPHLLHLKESEKQLSDLRDHHRVLIETIQQENAKFGDCQALTDVSDMMEKAKFYYAKLLKIKREMHALHEKSTKLKRRALRLQQEKQKEELQREHQREREAERERQLAAKPAKQPPKSSPPKPAAQDSS